MQESQLYAVWQALGQSKRWVEDGRHRLRVFDAGTLNLSFGPDFSGARFELDGTCYYGDVEMHVTQADWYRHRHHLNPFYRNVALHVVLTPPDEPARVQSEITRRSIPSFYLKPEADSAFNQRPSLPCRVLRGKLPEGGRVLQELALRRFHNKVRAMQEHSENASWAQVFYVSFLRTLGYPQNTAPFQLLAQQLPLSYLRRELYHPLMSFETLYAIYAGQAGFLDGPNPAPFVKHLRSVFDEFRTSLPAGAMSLATWQFSATRASNHPHFRLAAWVAFFCKTQGQPFERLYTLFAQRLPYPRLLKAVQELFRLPTQGYWTSHYRLSGEELLRGGKFFLGRARLFELLTNTILPVLAARALMRGSEGFFDYLQHFFLFLPQVISYGRLKRMFPWATAYHTLWPRHALGQALLQLEAEFCRVGACDRCPLRVGLDKKPLFD